MKKRVLVIILALVMCLAMVPTAALAADSEFEMNGTVLTKYNGPGGDVVIPNGVTSIGGLAFYGHKDVTSVTIPDSVTSIETNAFVSCKGLTSVTIPGSVTSIGHHAFYSCSSLTSVSIPEGVASIGTGAFCDCTSLTSVSISSSVTDLQKEAFGSCTSLHDIQVDSRNPKYVSADGIVFTKDLKTLVSYPAGRAGTYTIPSHVTTVFHSAFSGCENLTGVTIPNSVASLESGAFYSCTGLTNVDIPSSVTSMGEGVFMSCENLTSMTIPASVAKIGNDTFMSCKGLTSVTVSNGITNIGENVFWDCESLTSVTIPGSVTEIGKNAFHNCTSVKDVYYGGSESQWKAIKVPDLDIKYDKAFRDDLVAATIHYNSTMPEQPAQPVSITAQPTNDKLSVDGAAKSPAAYKIGGANYFKLRDVAMLLNGTNAQFEISYDNDKKAINITTGRPYSPQGYELQAMPAGSAGADTSNDAVYINGSKVDLTAYKINGANFYGIRDLGRALGFNVGWSQDRGMFIESGKPYSDAD